MSFFLYALFQLGTFLCSNAKMQRFDGPTFPGVGKATLQEVQLPEVRIATSLNGPTSFAGGKGAVREIAMPNADLHQIGTELRKVEVKRGLPEGDQKDAVEEGLVLADDNTVECETGKDPEALVGKKFLKIALPAKEKGPKATLTTTTMTSSTQLTTVEPKDRKEERTDSVGKEENRKPSGKPESETTKAKGAPALIPKGPPMPPPKSLPSGPPGATQNTQSPQQPPKPQVPLALPMPGGVGGRVRNYKLIYFDARGICEPIRLIFHYAKIPFDDVRISRKQWLALKDSTVYGKVPILEVDGKPLTYCHTIARYLARSFGIAGRDSWEEAKVDEVSDFHADVAMDLQPYMYVIAGFHQGDKNALRTSVFLPNVEKHFPVYVNLLKQSGSGFFVPSGITWVDFVVAEYMTTVRHFEPQILDKYPAINKFIRKVQTQPQIFDYITNREHQPVML